ncbi:MAG TPA: SOS response-associated peptidase [Acidimicrobiales bacterium]|nr:SOS response-associated peptidase [Acidimicrobiales bacterium]
MCGRYVAASPRAVLEERFQATPRQQDDAGQEPSWNVAPTDVEPVVTLRKGERRLEDFRWGLVPSWSKNMDGGPRMINARAETLMSRRAFQVPMTKRRCLVPADGYYEWLKRTGPDGRPERLPFYFTPADDQGFAFAGLWDVWKSPEGEWVPTFTIITVDANQAVAPIHDRMPAALRREDWDAWLDTDRVDPRRALEVLEHPVPADSMVSWPVGKAVNSVRNNAPQLVVPTEGHAPRQGNLLADVGGGDDD